MQRPRLLFLCQTLPYPPDGGVWIRTYHVLRLLARAFDITALCFERAGSAGSTNDRTAAHDALGQFADVEVFSIPQKHSRVRFLWDHLRSVGCARVYTAYLYESRAFRARVWELLQSTKFDLVHADSLDLASYLRLTGNVPTVCVHHDVESNLLRRRANLERSWRRPYLRMQARFMEETERRWCGRLALNVMFVLPSLSEGLPLALLEAMFAGCPIVASDVGDVSVALAQGEAGILVAPGHAAALARALDLLLSDPARARQLGERARRRASAEFDVSQMVRRYRAVYDDLLGRATMESHLAPVADPPLSPSVLD